MTKAVSLISGGMDSVTLAYLLHTEGYDLHLLSFDYGQRHKKELEYSERIAKVLSAEFDIVRLGVAQGEHGYTEMLGPALFSGSSLTDQTVEVPDGHYAEETMKATIVPNRNAIMLSIAYGVAVAESASLVAFAAHSGDHAIYPDCRPEFVEALEQALKLGNAWGSALGEAPDLRGPFLLKSKAEIVTVGTELGVPFEKTWTCYKGGKIHCGRCGTCVERKEAFMLAGVEDPTAYEDYSFSPKAPV